MLCSVLRARASKKTAAPACEREPPLEIPPIDDPEIDVAYVFLHNKASQREPGVAISDSCHDLDEGRRRDMSAASDRGRPGARWRSGVFPALKGRVIRFESTSEDEVKEFEQSVLVVRQGEELGVLRA